MNDDASCKNVYTQLIESGAIKAQPPATPITVLNICSLNIDDKIADSFRKMGRLLCTRKNMPFATWTNSSGGVHAGFFFRTCDNFEGLNKYLEDSDPIIIDGEDVLYTVMHFIRLLKEMDPDKQYDTYLFG